MRTHTKIGLGLTLGALASTTASGQTITTLVIEGQAVAGVGNVTNVSNMDVNDSGEWIVECDTDNSDTTMDGAVIYSTGQVDQEGSLITVPGFPLAGIGSWDSVRINNLGNTCWNHTLDNTMNNFDNTGVFWNSTLVIQEGNDTFPITGLAAPNPWTGFFEVFINDANQLLMMGSINEPTVGTTTTDRILVRLDLDATGAITGSTVVALEDDVLPGMGTGRLDDFDSGSNAYGFNDNGDAIFIADVDTPVNGDKIIYTWIGGTFTPIAEENTASFVDPLRQWQVLIAAVDMNDSGNFIWTGNLDGAVTDDDVFVIGTNTVFHREGDTFPAISPFVLGGSNIFGGTSSHIHLDNNDDIWWHGEWTNPDANFNNGLFRNDELLVQQGATMLEGLPIRVLSGGSDRFAVSDNGRYLVFEAELTDFREGVFMLDMLGVANLEPFCFGDGGTSPGCTDCPCGNNAAVGSGTGCVNSTGTGAVLTASGSPEVANDTLRFEVLGANISTFGILQSANNQLPNMGACAPGSGIVSPVLDGLRCVGGMALRHGTRASDANGDIGVTTNGWGPPNGPAGGLAANGGFVVGQTRHFQVFYREDVMAVCQAGQNTTNAITVTFQ